MEIPGSLSMRRGTGNDDLRKARLALLFLKLEFTFMLILGQSNPQCVCWARAKITVEHSS
jgi:hypothetical protein